MFWAEILRVATSLCLQPLTSGLQVMDMVSSVSTGVRLLAASPTNTSHTTWSYPTSMFSRGTPPLYIMTFEP